MNDFIGQFDNSNPEDVVKAPQGAIFFRHNDRFFVVVDNKVTDLFIAKKAFLLAYQTKPWFSYLKEEIISFKNPSETWIKKGKGNNKNGWEFVENSDPLIRTLTEQIPPTPTPTPNPTPTPSSTSPSPSYTPTPTESETPTPTPTPTESETPTPTPTESETPTPTPTPTESETPTPTPTESETPTPTPTPTESETPTPTPTESVTPTPTPTL